MKSALDGRTGSSAGQPLYTQYKWRVSSRNVGEDDDGIDTPEPIVGRGLSFSVTNSSVCWVPGSLEFPTYKEALAEVSGLCRQP
jgi:hypothetical protein